MAGVVSTRLEVADSKCPARAYAAVVLALDHLVIVAPTLLEGVRHVRECIDIDVPFGQRHPYMGTHNHLLQLGNHIYLEIVAIEPDGPSPAYARWFGLDDRKAVRSDWDAGRRLRGWVARTDSIDVVLKGREGIFGEKISLPWEHPAFDFTIPQSGAMPLGGAAPSIIDRRGKSRSMAAIADAGARMHSFSLEHPEAAAVEALYEALVIERAPTVVQGGVMRYEARIQTTSGLRELF